MKHYQTKPAGTRLVVMSILTTLGIAYGCGSETSSNRSRKEKNIGKEEDKKEDLADSKNEPPSKLGGSPGDTSQDSASNENLQDESILPRYLFKRADIEKIKKIVEPYRPIPSSPIPSLRNAANLSNFIETTVNASMKLPVHSPGRTFKVSIINNRSFNAFMTSDSRIGLHLPTAVETSDDELLAVICHEMAHSARNHGYKDAVELDRKIPSQLATRINTYFRSQLDQDRGIYTHNEPEYRKLREEWDQNFSEASDNLKRAESEADLIGARICNNMGMAIDVFTRALDTFFGRTGSGAKPRKLRDGDAFSNVEAKTLVKVLFPITEHPTGQERTDQINRLQAYLKGNLNDQDPNLYKNWKKGIKEAVRSVGNRGLSLAEDSPFRSEVRNEKTGETMDWGFSNGGCSHGHLEDLENTLHGELIK